MVWAPLRREVKSCTCFSVAAHLQDTNTPKVPTAGQLSEAAHMQRTSEPQGELGRAAGAGASPPPATPGLPSRVSSPKISPRPARTTTHLLVLGHRDAQGLQALLRLHDVHHAVPAVVRLLDKLLTAAHGFVYRASHGGQQKPTTRIRLVTPHKGTRKSGKAPPTGGLRASEGLLPAA